ncbi:hypothetical protein [Paenibacillus agilis]|uniref:Uncharacterized protein n=1 Tax=Paenibacillus agilis TaxID=3020863 RepID=A0A559IX22_9BACL|nr:hypothetical protein [Paenibacillus agilis]TVX92184.1 hypothetical protein FPZ44_03400 [Paenibacillus agilis]
MQHVIKNDIIQEQIDILRGIKGASSLKLYIDEVGEFALNFAIESSDRTINIKNTPTNASDGDEYPKLIIEHATTLSPDYKLMYEGNNLEDIFILSDVATWRNNNINWIVEANIGIKIVFQQVNFLILAQDSLAGLLKVFELNKTTPMEELLDDYWSMKTDKIDSLIRQEIKI